MTAATAVCDGTFDWSNFELKMPKGYAFILGSDYSSRRPVAYEATQDELLALADVVDKAHDVLLEKGWAGHAIPAGLITDRVKGHCMESAVNVALGSLTTEPFSMLDPSILQDWQARKLRDLGLAYTWNDQTGRTEDEVFDRMREVAKRLREEAGAL